MLMAFDVETTGLPDFKARSNDPKQPHIVQLAMVLHDDGGNEVQSVNMIVKPDGWTISAEMTAIHGISHERALAEGVAEKNAVAKFILWQALADLRVAHN